MTAATGAVTLAVVVAAVVRCDGHLVYVIDDAAIHLGIADKLARSGTGA